MHVLDQEHGMNWVSYLGDSAEVLKALPDASVHLSIFSPPFEGLYTYSPSERDLGNVRNAAEFFEHFAFITRELLRVMVPGRNVIMHAAEIQRYGNTSDFRHRYDFPGDCIRHMEQIGFPHIGRITIDKNPQAAAIRNHPQELLFATLRRDAAKLAVAQADYLLIFRVPGVNPIPITSPIDEETWIQWAHPVWTDIRETDILPVANAKGDDDERHLCALQLPVIERCVRLWSNVDETVLSPFGGIGSEGVGAIRHGRRAVLCELKEAYWRVGCKNLADAERTGQSRDLFALMGEPVTA